MATLRIKVRALVTSHTLVIPPISKSIPTTPALAFDLLRMTNPLLIETRGHEAPKIHSLSFIKFDKDLRRETKVSWTDYHVD